MFAVMNIGNGGNADFSFSHLSIVNEITVSTGRPPEDFRPKCTHRRYRTRNEGYMTGKRAESMDCDEFYRACVRLLEQAEIPFLVGGAYAFGSYTGISRDTKDLDIFLKPKDVERAVNLLEKGGYRCERTFPHWLAKAHCGEYVVDLIYRAGNGLCEVDPSWLDRACEGQLLGIPVKLCAPEEILWMKAFVMERERYDGADIAHIIESCAEKIDWQHLVQRFGPDWRLLLSHLLLFGYIFPSERNR